MKTVAPPLPQRIPLSGILLLASLAPASGVPPAAPPPPKPYTLYLGADVDVVQGKEFWRVRDVRGDSFVTSLGGRQQTISTNSGPLSLRVQRSLKLGSTVVTVAELKSDRIYTPANDPVRKFNREQPGSTGLSDYDLTEGNALEAATDLSMGNPNSPLYQDIQAHVNALQQSADQSAVQLQSRVNDPGEYAIRMQHELAQKLFDAIQITFAVSSPVPLTQPYLLIVAEYRDAGAPPNAVHNWIYTQSLDPIDRTPHLVTIRKGGFPKGFQWDGFQFHLYDRGRELVTTVADRQLHLTRDEAFEYTLLDYFSSHKGESVPASPVMVQLPPDLRSHVSDDQFTQTYYVKVTKDGLPAGAYADADCHDKIEDAYLQSVLMDLRFAPELKKGLPMEGVALVKLSHLR